jgi:hypothetical protein
MKTTTYAQMNITTKEEKSIFSMLYTFAMLSNDFYAYAMQLTLVTVNACHVESIEMLYCATLNNKERNLIKRAETTLFNRSLLESKSEAIEKALKHFNIANEFTTAHKIARYLNNMSFEVKNRKTQKYEMFILDEKDMINYVVRHCNHLTSKLSHLYKREVNEANTNEFKIVRKNEIATKLLTIAE